MKKKSQNSVVKFSFEYLPLIIFFAVYKLSSYSNPLIAATIYMVAFTFIILLISYILYQEIPTLALFSAVLLGIFGGLTIILKDEIFIKMKPTIVNLSFATILLYGYFSKKPLVSYVVGEQIKLSNQAWLKLSLNWALFFVFLAVLNEFIWRNFATDFWVKFKVFGMMPLSIIFTALQLPFIMREMAQEEKKNITN